MKYNSLQNILFNSFEQSMDEVLSIKHESLDSKRRLLPENRNGNDTGKMPKSFEFPPLVVWAASIWEIYSCLISYLVPSHIGTFVCAAINSASCIARSLLVYAIT